MQNWKGRIRCILWLGVVMVFAARWGEAAEPKIKIVSAGLSFDNFSRTVTWTGDAASSKIRTNLISARGELGFGKGVLLSLSTGLALTDFEGLAFTSLPISLQYDAPALQGFSLGTEVVAPLLGFSDFEISGTGSFVYSFGMSKTWPLEGFAVEGEAAGKSSWMEAAIGTRLSYLTSGPVIPYLEICARWLRADFDMTETLGDLSGTEAKRVRGDFSFSVALGADAAVIDHLGIRARAGILPYPGGVDGLASVGVLYKF